ncbi:MAG: autotransporter-associated beta strand repeat-containing protein, partial [Verrucomicrobiales bacterium]|nr:autotransporter-associated beta strand repeat-containing protein [Verrucomicrobiales bacterium]
MKTVTWRKLMTVSGFLCLPLADAAAANQDWSATPSGTNDSGQYLANSGTNWSSGNAPVGNGDRWRFAYGSTGTNIYNDFAPDTKFILLFEYSPPAYTISGNRINLSGLTNNSDQTETLNLDVLMNSSLNVGGNNAAGTIDITGTLFNSGGNWNLTPMLSGTLSIGGIALSESGTWRTFNLGALTEKGALNTANSNPAATVSIGNISNGGSGASSFNNGSLSHVLLTGTNSYTGATAFGAHSFTELVYSAADGQDQKLSTTNGLSIYSGTLLLTGGTVRETLNGNLNLGRNSFGSGVTYIERSSGSSSIKLNGSVTRTNNGAPGSLSIAALLQVGADNLLGSTGSTAFGNGYGTSGIVGTWVTIGGKDWAVWNNDPDSPNHGMLSALTEYNDDFASWNTGEGGTTRSVNALLTTSGSLLSDRGRQISTLKIDTATGSGTLQIGNTLSLFSGGLIFTGANDYKIEGGALVSDSANAYQLNIWQNGAGELEIASDLKLYRTIAKAGDGTLLLSGSNSYGNSDSDSYVNRTFMLFGGTVRLGSDHAINDPKLRLFIESGALDLHGHNAAVNAVVGQSDGKFVFTNSDNDTLADLIVGIRDDTTTSDYYGLGGGTVLTGNLRLVLQGNSATPVSLYANTHTGGVKFLGNLTQRNSLGLYRVTTTDAFGAAGSTVEFGDNGGFAVSFSGDWSNPVTVSGSNAFIYGESKQFNATGKWTGSGDIELRNRTDNTGIYYYALLGDMSEFSGTVKVSSAGNNQASKFTDATKLMLSGTALNSPDATYTLWRSQDSAGTAESTLNVALQFDHPTAGATYDAYLGDLTSANQSGGAAMNGGVVTDLSQGVVSNNRTNSTVTLHVGSANHAYSEFAERIIDSGMLNNAGALVNVVAGAKVAVDKVGTGTWALTGSNSYSGSTTVSGGVLLISGEGNLANTSAVTVSGGTLQLTDNGTIANPNNNAVEVTNGALLVDTAYAWT